MKRAYGGGRKALTGQPQSRKAVYKYLASDYAGISDNVIQHMKSKAQFDLFGIPVQNIDQFSGSKIRHTEYLFANNMSKNYKI